MKYISYYVLLCLYSEPLFINAVMSENIQKDRHDLPVMFFAQKRNDTEIKLRYL